MSRETRVYEAACFNKHNHVRCKLTTTSLCLHNITDLIYESRLLDCGLTTLEARRLRGDQIEMFKIVNGYEDVDRNMFFKLKEGSRTRGHKAA